MANAGACTRKLNVLRIERAQWLTQQKQLVADCAADKSTATQDRNNESLRNMEQVLSRIRHQMDDLKKTRRGYRRRRPVAPQLTQKVAKTRYFAMEQHHRALMDKLKGERDETARQTMRDQINAVSIKMQALSDLLATRWGFDVDDAMDDDFLL